jgi:uncharacterized protein YgiM (DUF1202 family)
MKNKLWLVFGILCSTSLLGQQASNAPASDSTGLSASASAPAVTSAPVAPGRTARRDAELRTTPLKPGPATVIANHVNVRGQARLKGEILTRLSRGQQVTVLDEVTLDDSAADEPSAWAKISLPPGARTWVNTNFIDPNTKTVTASRLNVRGGPGENYSIIGRIERGTTVKEMSTKGDWLEIEPPAEAYAFLAAQYLSQESTDQAPTFANVQPTVPDQPIRQATPVEDAGISEQAAAEIPTSSSATNEPPPEVTTIPDVAHVAEPPVDGTPTNEVPTVAQSEAAATTNETDSAAWRVTPPSLQTDTNQTAAAAEEQSGDEETELEEPPPPRIVQREGVVRGSGSIQAPTRFELFSPDSGKIINYLYTTARDLDLSRYKGLRIIVTGEEALDQRWHNTPVLTIQRIQVLE